ncbi:hypothetical protein [Phormidium sp. CCY1219]|uniref:hypothetical protein n=1 Tax=Phormidium sp. CCY1219 TaxID=2886104 RepID=UPI002D1EEF29|nr:hypothetical protein [Phormidium sp. CCY1219]MEB3831527.1 hypothetical protein [Phormidium sp. CCY1219]
MSFVLYAPNVHLFAFHRWEIEDAEVDPDYRAHYLQDCCKEIFQRFGIPPEAFKL